MTTEAIELDNTMFNSRLSFRPLITSLKKILADCKPGSQMLYGDLISRFESL